MTLSTNPTRVLVVEDSPTYRELMVLILQNTPGLQVIGTARNGAEAVRLARRLQPNIITMDVFMPEMDGLEATRQIMAQTPCPIIMISAGLDQSERNLTFEALQAGALSFLAKPALNDPPETYEYLARQVKLMAEVKVVRRWDKAAATSSQAIPPIIKETGHSDLQLVAIAASTGGPAALAEILHNLPATFPLPILIVQHITPGFGQGLAAWLNRQTPLEVRMARHTDEPQPGQVLIAPDNYHTQINNMGLVALNQTPAYYGLRPAANVLFSSVAQVYGATALGIILTGMGDDGAEGLLAMRRSGARTIAQDKESSIVFGMPAVAIEKGAVEQVLPLNSIAPAMVSLAGATDNTTAGGKIYASTSA